MGCLLAAGWGMPRKCFSVWRVWSGLQVAFACAVGRSEKLLQSFQGFKFFKGLRAGKRQAWTPIRSHWCGLGVPVGCGMRHAKKMFQRLKGLKRVTPGERHRQAGPPRRSDGCGLGVAFAGAVGRSEKLLQSFKGFKPFKGFEGLRAGKRQAWTPIRSHWCGLGVLVGCGMRHAKKMFQRLRRVTPGERHRQAGPPRRSDGCGLGVAFACAVGRSEKLLQSFKGFKHFKRLRAEKRQAWTPIRSDWCGLRVPVGCGVRHAKRMFKRLKGLIRHAKRMFKRLKGLKRVTPGERQAGPSHWCGLGVACLTAKKPLMWPWGFCVRGWACNAVTREGCGGKRQADGSCREALKHLKLRKTSSTPAVVPGAAPALAKAGVGGLFLGILNLEFWIVPPWNQEVFSEPWTLNLESYPLGFKIFSEPWILNRESYPLGFKNSLLESWILNPWIQVFFWALNLESWILNPTPLDSSSFLESWILRP